ncbi:Orphan sodium- and chloride-dependent neurotransmitter transporter NTT5 [Microtus ochrogaster]|uniref:Orphan sodium- and chloride-dependent neurotransmitter transporter NTT5 n=1 Tax=Microtus ochrogaster TaxID=79684 RepID=A0A8J6GIU0_MICOH|nr:Orphan sodium- and chloride-dependent neurotransmitter transporter NTT5 [Microtus ochrogaster]
MYLILLLVGIPLLYMEMIIGQWPWKDNIQAWKQLAPWLRACVLVSLYNSALISWNVMYLGGSFDYPPPWEQCKMHSHDHGNISMTKIQCLRTVPYQYFWYHTTLDASSQVEEGIEKLVLTITLCLFATCIFLYIILIIRIRNPPVSPVSSLLLMCLILLLLLGIPLLYMEMIIGQWLRKDNIQAWKQLAPWLSGLGYSSTLQKRFSSLCSVCVPVNVWMPHTSSWHRSNKQRLLGLGVRCEGAFPISLLTVT